MKKISLAPSILITTFAVSLLWCIKSFELMSGVDLSFFTLTPKDPAGAIGIVTAPLLHGSVGHLFNNTLALLLLGTALLYGYPRSRLKVLASIWLVSGIGVWLFGRPAMHLGASGLTHGIFFFLLVIGIFRRDKTSVALMMIAFFMYGGMTMTIFPREPGISFEYHFFGAFAGVVAAIVWRNEDPKPVIKPYEWEKSPDLEDPVIGDQWKAENEQDMPLSGEEDNVNR